MLLGITVRHICVAALVAVVGAGCGDGGDGGEGSGSATAATPAPDGTQEPSDRDVVMAYAEAMSDGDIDAAMDLRCEAGRIAADDRAAFEDDLRRFTDAVGRVGVGRVEVTDEDPDVEPRLEDRDAVELTYWLTFDGDEVDEPLVAIVVDEDRERRICAVTTTELARLQATLGNGLADLGPARTDTLAALMPSSSGPGYRLSTDGRMDLATLPVSLDDAVDGWARTWEHETYGGVTVSAMRFPSGEDAMTAARRRMAEIDQPAVETFDVPGLPGAQGVRVLALEWLWMQPPTVGPYVDEVSLVFGDTYVTVAIGGVPTGAGHDDVVTHAQAVARLASGAA